MMPVILLSEGFLGNGSEPWKIPDMSDFPTITPPLADTLDPDEPYFYPFRRDPETLVRRWALPGTPGMEHRVGGLEKNHRGAVSSDPLCTNKWYASVLKIERLAHKIPPLEVLGEQEGDILMVSWEARTVMLAPRANCAHKTSTQALPILIISIPCL